MTQAHIVFVLVCALVQSPTSVYSAESQDCQKGSSMPPLDDASALLQSRANLHSEGILDMKELLKDDRQDKLAATMKMEESMERAVEEMVTSGGGHSVSSPVLESIQAEMVALSKGLVEEQKNFQQQMDNANAAAEKCNTNMKSTQGDSVAKAKDKMDMGNATHHKCRKAELSAYNEKNSSCKLLVSKSEEICTAAPSCSCEPNRQCDSKSLLACFEEQSRWVKLNKESLKEWDSDCEDKTNAWRSKADICDTDQSNYELAFCSHAEKLLDMCSTLTTCYSDAIVARESTERIINAEEKELKAMMASIKKILCYLSILTNSSSKNVTMSDLDVCRNLNVSSDRTYSEYTVEDMTITYDPAVKQDTCVTVDNTPGDGEWADKEYTQYRQDWLRETAVCSHKTTTTTTTTTSTTTTTTTYKARTWSTCQWTTTVTGSISGNNIKCETGETLAGCKTLCQADTACKSIDFKPSDGTCCLGSCYIGDGTCTNDNDVDFKYSTCEACPNGFHLLGTTCFGQPFVTSTIVSTGCIRGNCVAVYDHCSKDGHHVTTKEELQEYIDNGGSQPRKLGVTTTKQTGGSNHWLMNSGWHYDGCCGNNDRYAVCATQATTTTTTTQATCTFTLTMKRKWGANWMLDVQGAVGDTFTAQGCSPTARGASDCIANGWGAGITPVVNQHGNVVAYGNCCIEENEVTNTSKCKQAR